MDFIFPFLHHRKEERQPQHVPLYIEAPLPPPPQPTKQEEVPEERGVVIIQM